VISEHMEDMPKLTEGSPWTSLWLKRPAVDAPAQA
jgi:hypothetical protein